MKVVLQRVISGSVSVDNRLISSIDKGYVLLVGIGKTDSEQNITKMAKKIADFRIFPDSDGKMNLKLEEVNGKILSVPQFTVMGNTQKGNRPGFDDAAEPQVACKLWNHFNVELRSMGIIVEEGMFGAHMKVNIHNDGPVTFVLDN